MIVVKNTPVNEESAPVVTPPPLAQRPTLSTALTATADSLVTSAT